MSCDELLALLRAGQPLSGAEAAAHLAACDDCATLARELEGWGSGLLGAGAEPAPDLVALRAGLAARLERERGALGWLRSRPTWMRFLVLLVIAGAGPVVLSGLNGWPLREDLRALWMPRYVAEAALLALIFLAGAWSALRPVQRPATRPLTAVLALLLALVVALTLALLPQAHQAEHPLEPASACFRAGLQFGLPLAVCALLLARWVSWPVIALTGLAAGTLADLTLHLICPDPRPMHLLLGHASVVALFVGTALLAGLLPARGAPATSSR